MTRRQWVLGSLAALALLISLLGPWWGQISQAQVLRSCQLPEAAIAQKSALLQAALGGDPAAQQAYQALIGQHGQQLRQCRNQEPVQAEGIWLRLYPCDSQPGVLEAVLDRIVNQGYNQVFVDTFSDGQVLLPSSDNPTAWPAVVRSPGYERTDLLAQVIQKGHDRGLSVYAWLFSLNFGYTYASQPDKAAVLARNGQGDNSLTLAQKTSQDTNVDLTNLDEMFVDPYSPQARSDYLQLIQAVLKRRPDGVLFDYIRYPKGIGAASVVSQVKDLWIYGDASLQALYQRAQNQQGVELMRRYVTQGRITAADLTAIAKLYPTEPAPLWQGRSRPHRPVSLGTIQSELWALTVEHAMQGVLDFLAMAVAPVQQQGLATGAAFFPEGNQAVGKGFDSRLQPWPRFPASIEWHPMAYAVCGNASCITAQVQKVLSQAPTGTIVAPVLTGQWQQATPERPSLVAQMEALQTLSPPVRSLSHFSFGWLEPQIERQRQFCRL